MRVRHISMAAVSVTTMFLAAAGTNCVDAAGEGNLETRDVIFEGGASREALDALLDGELVTDAARAANFTAPTNDAVVASSSAPTFDWQVGSTGAAGVTSDSVFFLVFATTKNPKLLRVFTTQSSYAPDGAALAKLQGAGETIHAVVTHAELDDDRIAAGGGPFGGVEITFTLH
jgi:hypothetical protein